MTVHSGKYGVASGYSTVYNWVINELREAFQYRTSNTNAGTGRTKGIYDYNGSFEGYACEPPVMPGQYFDFIGYTAPTDGARGSAGDTVTATNAIVESVSITWDWTTGSSVRWTVNFACGVPQVLSSGSGTIVDDTVPTLCDICGVLLQAGPAAGEADIEDTTQCVLNISSNNVPYVNASTNCIRGRRPGIVDYTLAITQEASAPEFSVGNEYRFLLKTSAVEPYTLEWAFCDNISDFRVDMDSGDIISMTYNFSMAARAVSDGALGRIQLPSDPNDGSSPWWPVKYNALTYPV